MPEWLKKSMLKQLAEIDTRHENGLITKAQHDKESNDVLEQGLAIERNITLKHDATGRILGDSHKRSTCSISSNYHKRSKKFKRNAY